MTLAMCCHIVFPANERRSALQLRRVAGIEVSTSINDVCQTATITLPGNLAAFRMRPLRDQLRRGDEVIISMGYDGNLYEAFRGWVQSVGADVPIVITCRDGMWKLLQQSFHRAYQQCHVPTLLRDLVGERYQVVAMDATIGPLRFERARKADAFKALQDEFGLVTYLRGDTVYCGVPFSAASRTVRYDMERNVKSADLKYRMADEVQLKVTARSILRDGSNIEVEVGDENGEQRTLTYYGITNRAELEKLARADMEKFKYDGYEGGFKAFGIPVCEYGDRVDLRSSEHPDRNGQYLVEAVTITFGPDGYQRDIKLAQQWTVSNA